MGLTIPPIISRVVVSIKCKYSNCKLGGEVDKEIAVKDGTSYYHEECYNKQQDKRSCHNILVNKLNFMARQVNMILKKVIDDQSTPSDYVLWMVAKIYREKLVLNTPFGVEYYLKNGHNWNEFKKQQQEIEYKALKKKNVNVETEIDTVIKFDLKGVSYVDIFKG